MIFNRPFLDRYKYLLFLILIQFTFTERTIDILEKHDKDKPFFIYFASQNAHLPNQVGLKLNDL